MDSKINGGKLEPANVFRRDVSARTAGAVTVANGGYAIADTATTAQVGDIYRPETATTAVMVRKEYKVIAARANSFTIASKDIPTIGDTFFILAPVTPKLNSSGVPEVSVDTTGLATEDKQDDQIVILGDIQDAVDSIDLKTPVVGQAVMASSSPVVIASNQTSIPVAATLSAETSKVIGTVRIDQSTPGTTNGVQVNAPLPAGTNNIGEIDVVSLPSIPAGTNNIGDVDVLTLPPIPAGTNNIGDVDVASLPVAFNAGPASATTQRVILATDQTPFADLSATGNITTQNLVPAGAATAGSAVLSGTLNGQNCAAIQVTGTYTGALSLQGTVDNTNWITIGGLVFTNVNTGVQAATITTGQVGIFQVDCAGYNQIRATGLAAMTGTAVVTIRASSAAGLVGLDLPIPTGANIIGALTSNQSVNVAQVAGVTTATGAGTSSTGTQRVAVATGATGANARIPSSTSSVTLLAASTARLGTALYNESSAVLYITFGATASATNYVLQIPPGGYYELPGPHIYNGVIAGIWASVSGFCQVTSW